MTDSSSEMEDIVNDTSNLNEDQHVKSAKTEGNHCEEDSEEDESEEENWEEGREMEDDELIKAIKAAKEKNRKHPPDLNFEDIIVDISFHPSANIIAAGSVVGDVIFYKYSNEENELLRSVELHVSSCRNVEFSDDGLTLYSCGKDKSIMITDSETGKLKKFYDDAHEDPLYSLYVFDTNIICTGDEEGTVKVWDIRRNKPVMSFKKMEDFVSDMVTNEAKKVLVCSSGDGTITSFNISSKKMLIQSEGYDSELNCMQLIKHERKLVTCSSKGKMYLFNWGEFGYHSDEYFGLKNSINSMVAITENMVVLGYDDGNIRAVNFFPQKQLGVVGQHDFSIESLDISHDGEFIASSSIDQKVKFWNIRYFEDLIAEEKKTDKKIDMEKNLPSSKVKNFSDFFGEMMS
ncbi:WD-repeat protein, putative [Pediculus humanus corporis]|uniref:WD repeat-containing protein 55 homolog n=1 Tax=Pediculus humanus subsp. corporis TaxID=121224 RepID=E0VGC9_PEDHC|nr:WD-repeat protein, putative [Pediculus humanus corporis]EEB12435.1 WD-repeat protein, putative [Pediculus humanus corporis]